MLILVAGIAQFIATHSLDLTWPEYANWRSAGKSARQKTKGVDLLVFGTSMPQQSLLPSVLRERIDGEAYNLSICAGQAPANDFGSRS